MEKEVLKPLKHTVDDTEIAKFAAMAEEWWDENGKFAPLHKFNPVRIGFIKNQILAMLGREDEGQFDPLQGVSILDIGCGGGLLCEPMKRMGADIIGIDATQRSIEIAKAHAEMVGLDIDYRYTTAEALGAAGEQFDVVLNMEVVEHVADVDAFLKASADLVKPGGIMILATMNRTMKAFALAIVGAEYVLGWLPRGTHDWRKFLKPSELAAGLRPCHMKPDHVTGVSYNPISDSWALNGRDLSVNYLMVAKKMS